MTGAFKSKFPLYRRHTTEEKEYLWLAPYASQCGHSQGRMHREQSALGSEFKLDRERILNCAAFERLQYKMQLLQGNTAKVVINRMTHSLEVVDIGRSIARELRLNEYLVEAISLAHDLGHAPFGHSGQRSLNACMRLYGGFEHNLQGLRVVDLLEEHIASPLGLNLTFETREGILKSCSARDAKDIGALGLRFLERTQPTLEAQLVNVVDEITYSSHDIFDGLLMGLIRPDELKELCVYPCELFEKGGSSPESDPQQWVQSIRELLAQDLISQTKKLLLETCPKGVEDVRGSRKLVCLSNEGSLQLATLKKFAREKLHSHPVVVRADEQAQMIVPGIFEMLMNQPALLPQARPMHKVPLARRVADHIASMTDEESVREYTHLRRPRSGANSEVTGWKIPCLP